MDEKVLETVKSTVEKLMQAAGFPVEVTVGPASEDDAENIICSVRTEADSNLLIGQHGVNLQAFQHLIRLIVRRQVEDKIKFILDINDYRQEKNQSVLDMAREAAEEATREGRAVMLRPMSPYERRLIHMELSQNDRVTTESVGEGETRKVVIKPQGLLG